MHKAKPGLQILEDPGIYFFMTTTRKRSKKKGNLENGEEEKPTKDEYEVAKFLRFNVKIYEGKLVGMGVNYFIASEAIDKLLDSQWASGKKRSSSIKLTNRAQCVDFCDKLLRKGLFHRADKVTKSKSDKKKKKKDDDDSKQTKKKEEKTKEKETKKEKKSSDPDSKKDEKRKWKLEMSDEQRFVDGENAYVWIYDPMPWYKIVIGTLMVIAAIAICLFPLWPPFVRDGFWYVSVGLAGLVGSLFGLGIVRFILFSLCWLFSMGRITFWLFPNLFADCGFFESFQPTYELTGKENKKEKDKEDKTQANPTEKEQDETEQHQSPTAEPDAKQGHDEDQTETHQQTEAETASGDRELRRGSSEDSSNGFEIVDVREGDDDESG